MHEHRSDTDARALSPVCEDIREPAVWYCSA
jgi:hypothetical protein